jgi:hypothetical protein
MPIDLSDQPGDALIVPGTHPQAGSPSEGGASPVTPTPAVPNPSIPGPSSGPDPSSGGGARKHPIQPTNAHSKNHSGARTLATKGSIPPPPMTRLRISQSGVTFTLKRSVDHGRIAVVDVRVDPLLLHPSAKIAGHPAVPLQPGVDNLLRVDAGRRVTVTAYRRTITPVLSPPESADDSDEEPHGVLVPGLPVFGVVDSREKGKGLAPHVDYHSEVKKTNVGVAVRRTPSGIDYLTH